MKGLESRQLRLLFRRARAIHRVHACARLFFAIEREDTSGRVQFPIRPTNYSRRALSLDEASRAMTARYRRQVLMSLVHQLSYRPLGEVSNIGVTEAACLAGW